MYCVLHSVKYECKDQVKLVNAQLQINHESFCIPPLHYSSSALFEYRPSNLTLMKMMKRCGQDRAFGASGSCSVGWKDRIFHGQSKPVQSKFRCPDSQITMIQRVIISSCSVSGPQPESPLLQNSQFGVLRASVKVQLPRQ